MLDIRSIAEDPQKISAALAKKGCVVDFTELLSWDAERRKTIQEVETFKAEKNKVSAEIPKLKKEGKPVDGIFAEMKELGNKIAEGDGKQAELENKIFDFLCRLPNIPDDDLLPGEKENNQVVKVFGEKPSFDFEAKNHVDLCTSLGLIDYERGVKLSGNGYWIYRGKGAQLEW
ncbi:MAG: serine--tRNA ligase, partial [Clostridia bacterium]|nr:serine--tRNA ligase [Clostridia bacterium]